MEFNALQQYRPSSSKSNVMGQSSPTTAAQMYTYSNFSFQRQQPQVLQQVSRASPPRPTWAVPQSHNPYYHGSQGHMVTTRDEHPQLHPSSTVVTTQGPAFDNASFSNSMHSNGMATSAEYFPNVIDTSPWGAKVCEELESFPSLDSETTDFGHALMGQDENTPIIDLRQFQGMAQHETDNLAHFNSQANRRMSESSFSMSSTGGGMFPDVSSYEDIGSSEAVSYTSECDAWNTAEPTGGHLMSPLASPRKSQYETVARTGGRARMSPAPHNNVRSSPYTLESTRFKRWSTGQAPTSTPTNSRAVAQIPDQFAPYGPRPNPHHSMPSYPASAMANFGISAQNVLFSQPHHLQSSGPPLFATRDQPFHLEVPRPLPSQGLFRLLQSNVDRHGGCSSHFADLSDPPDLYSSLLEEQPNPPESDMNPSDPDLVPHEQDLRFNGDLYTPRWVRGHGNKREGWCGLCKPGRWLVLKNSAFWYDKSFTHGVSAATGAAFQGPQDTRRTEGNLDVWEGLCGSCGEWIALVSSKKKGTTWFRHAYKCHTHPKVKDGPKRRRETQAGRARAVSSASASSSSQPVKQESTTCNSNSQRHSTPTPITGSSAFRAFGMSTSTPTTTPTPSLSTTSYGSSTPYTTSTAATPSMFPPQTPTTTTSLHGLSTPTTAALPQLRYGPSTAKDESVFDMFSTTLQGFPSFSTPYSGAPSMSPAHQVSEPELVGIRTTTSNLNSIASMI